MASTAAVASGGDGSHGNSSSCSTSDDEYVDALCWYDEGPVARAVSLRWLLGFVHARRGTVHSWEVVTDHLSKEYLAPADGGGGAAPLVVTRGQLVAHRAARARAEAARSGMPVVVRYADIVTVRGGGLPNIYRILYIFDKPPPRTFTALRCACAQLVFIINRIHLTEPFFVL